MADNSTDSTAAYEGNLPFKRRFNLMLAKQAMDTSPTPSWGAGLARALTGGLAGIYEKQDDETENKANTVFTNALLAARSPQYDPQAMGAALSRPAASVDQMLPGGRPAPAAAPGKIYRNDEPSPLDPPSGNDRDLMARTIVAEAGNQPQLGQDAVASVIRNRAVNGGNTPAGVVQAPNQFEPWNTAGGRDRMAAIDPNSPQYANASKAISTAYGEGGRAPNDPTAGKTMFYAPAAQAALGRPAPSWANGGNGQPIGDHVFYNAPGVQSQPQAPGQPQQPSPSQQPPQGLDPRVMAAMNNPNIPVAHKVQLIQALAPNASYGVIGKDQFGNEQYGWIDQTRRQVTPGPYATSSQQAAAGGGNGASIPAPPPGADPKVWREAATKNAAGNALPATQQDTAELRKEVMRLPSYQNYAAAAPIFRSMKETAGRDSKASDLNLVYGLGKILDPTSVVREGELIMAKNTAALPDWVLGSINAVNGGAALTPETRKAILAEAHSRMQSYEQLYGLDTQHYHGIAQRNRMDSRDVVPQFEPATPWEPKQSANNSAPAAPQASPPLDAVNAELARRGVRG